MTKTEFDRLKAEYEYETMRYMAVRPGDIIYEWDGFDNFAHEVVEVDVENRVIRTLDKSLNNKPILLTHWHSKPQPVL